MKNDCTLLIVYRFWKATGLAPFTLYIEIFKVCEWRLSYYSIFFPPIIKWIQQATIFLPPSFFSFIGRKVFGFCFAAAAPRYNYFKLTAVVTGY